MRFLWIFLIECLVEVLCGVERLKFKRDAGNNKTKIYKNSSSAPADIHEHEHDHDHHHTVIFILVGVLCGIVFLGFCAGIITCIYCCWKKKKGINTEEKGSKVPPTLANEYVGTAADNSQFRSSNPGQNHASENRKRSVGKTVASIFGSAQKVEPRAPKTSATKKRKVKLISTKGRDGRGERKKSYYMQNDQQQESSVIDEMINPPGFSAAGSKEIVNPPKTSTAPVTRNSSNAALTSALPSNTILTTTIGGGKTFETAEINQGIKPPGDGTSTSYEEAEKKSMEVIDGPCVPAGFRARGPLAPHHIAPEKWKHRGGLVIKKRHKVVLKHELQNDPPVEPKSNDHVEFDSKMNEVVDFGPGVEHVISNKSVLTTISTANPESTPKPPPNIINRDKLQQQRSSNGATPSAAVPVAADSNKKGSKKVVSEEEAKTDKTQEVG